jgi:hypothetical protein
MTALTRLLTCLTFLLVVVAGVTLTRPEWAGDLGLDWQTPFGTGSEGEDEEQRTADLDRKTEAVQARLAGKRAVIKDLIEGKTTLRAAATRFGELNDTPAWCRNPFREPGAGNSAEERLSRQVIDWARGELSVYPADQAEAVGKRLRAEWEDPRCGPGPFAFPGW